MDGLDLGRDGAELHRTVLGETDLQALEAVAARLPVSAAGVRLRGDQQLSNLLSAEGPIGRIAAARLGDGVRPVRALLFDKREDCNWAVAWHQDRVIAVRERRDAPGFGPWSIKAGTPHVQPPFALLAGMLTLRAHLDPCDADNAALLVAKGSHRLGRVAADAAARIAEAGEVIRCDARRGDVWAYSTPVLHASRRAVRPARRRVVQVDYAVGELPAGLEWAGV